MDLLINGITNNDYKEFEAQLDKLESTNKKHYKLREMDINFCQGCWDCWVKTPGKCVFKDDYEQILTHAPNAETITLISPVVIGYVSSLIKKFQDRFIPTIHPYIICYKGEQHHRKRYPNSPKFNIVLLEDEHTSEEDINLIKDYYNRVMLNMHSSVENFIALKKGEDYQNVINNI